MADETSSAEERKYDVMAYDPRWAELFASESEKIRGIFGDSASVMEHVGSTSVPGMSGKPTIDILVLMENIESVSDGAKNRMVEAGYAYLGEYVRPGALLFAKEEDNKRLVNVHAMPMDHSEARNMLVFRDYLRSHPDDAMEYSKLKLELFRKYPDDYARYRALKDEYLNVLRAKANGPRKD